jgi:hypothetical protein
MAFFYLFILLITSGASLQVRKNKSASNFYRRFLTQGAFKPKSSLCLEFCALKNFSNFQSNVSINARNIRQSKVDSLNKWGIEQSPGPMNDGTMIDDASFAKYIGFDYR